MPDLHCHERFVELLTQHRAALFGYIYALVRRLEDAEDLYQDTALVMWSKFREYEPGTNFVAWACTIARFRAANFLKRERRRRCFSLAIQEELAALQATMAEDTSLQHDALIDCMKGLGRGDRQLIDLCYGAAKTFREAAEQLGRSPQSVYDSLSRIRRALLRCVDRTIARQQHPRDVEEPQ
ncbi:MAG: sigma-70 family RNA polymerase sigma factor [Thermoguttaceae bacterium]